MIFLAVGAGVFVGLRAFGRGGDGDGDGDAVEGNGRREEEVAGLLGYYGGMRL